MNKQNKIIDDKAPVKNFTWDLGNENGENIDGITIKGDKFDCA